MNIPKFHRIFTNLITILMLSLLSAAAGAEEAHDHDHSASTNFQEGKNYHRITPAVATEVEEGKVEVLELFWYGCPHCFEFETFLSAWKDNMPEYVSFKRMPAVMNQSWAPHARAFYALETMGELERIHPIFFEAIHVQGRRLTDVESMARFLSQHDVDAEKFKSAYNSMYVETKIKRSNQLVRQYGASSVPTVIVNGKYRSTASDAGGYENLIRLINLLAEREKADSVTAGTPEASAE
jgi:thiol:disulfide interchange protein DsbA